MRNSVKTLAIHIALIAMVLRALLPAGWMPGADASSGLVICSLAAHAHATSDTDGGGKQPDQNSTHDECPFASAAHSAALAGDTTGVRILDWRPLAYRVPLSSRVLAVARFKAQSPRAPPSLA